MKECFNEWEGIVKSREAVKDGGLVAATIESLTPANLSSASR